MRTIPQVPGTEDRREIRAAVQQRHNPHQNEAVVPDPTSMSDVCQRKPLAHHQQQRGSTSQLWTRRGRRKNRQLTCTFASLTQAEADAEPRRGRGAVDGGLQGRTLADLH